MILNSERRAKIILLGSGLLTIIISLLIFIPYETIHSSKSQTEQNNAKLEYWLKELTLEEKCNLLRGSLDPHGYTGYVPGVPRLGIPSLRFNDGPQGFRGPKKTSTAWPCGLAMAATFWPELVEKVALATGVEFIQKGANIFLGPGMNIARIPQNGRNFEYLCGEDPFLGEAMASSFVEGLQSNPGLIATAKHYVNNEQETNRQEISAIVDPETEWNLYYRPFLASVRANIGAVMCSYNKINNDPGCSNLQTLTKDLKGTMKFNGFVMSDWFATRDTINSAIGGLDVEMPIPIFYGDALRIAVESKQISESIVNEKVSRVLKTILKFNLTEPHSEDFNPKKNVSNAVHNQLARFSASNGIILLKNENNLLPIVKNEKQPIRILVAGNGGRDYVIAAGEGSGHVSAPYIISPFQGLSVNGKGFANVSYLNTIEALRISKRHFSFFDRIIIFVGISSTEGFDRMSLSLDSMDLQLINYLTDFITLKNIIVLITAPGPVLIPFQSKVQAILLQFFPGQEVGNAISDVIYGIVDPGGARLPITIPNKDNEQQMDFEQYPGINLQSKYTERTNIGYRWYAAHPEVTPMYEFGYGLSFASFKFLGLDIHRTKSGDFLFHIGIMNLSNDIKGVIVPQVYITQFPEDALRIVSPIALIGFKRLDLKPQEIKTATIPIKVKSFAVWTQKTGQYRVTPGQYVVSVGNSCSDFWTSTQVHL